MCLVSEVVEYFAHNDITGGKLGEELDTELHMESVSFFYYNNSNMRGVLQLLILIINSGLLETKIWRKC